MNFRYRVRDSLGKLHEGTVDATNSDDATQQLRRDGFAVLHVEATGARRSLLGGRVSRSELVYMTTQLGLMIDTGINLSLSLQALAEQEANAALKSVLEDLRNAVEGGEDFSAALARHPRLFDATYVALVRAAEATGALGEMLDRVADHLRREVETRAKVRSAMAYPSVMLCLAIGVTVFLIAFVFPKFAPLFERRSVDLPKPTVVMLAISQGLTNYWYFWLGGLVVLIGGLLFALSTSQGRRVWDWIKISLPIIGPTYRKVIIGRSLRTLGTMLAGGVPLLESLDLCGRVAANWWYEQLWSGVAQAVTEGNRLASTLSESSLLPPTIVQMISSGEEAGKLDRVLARISTYYDREVENALKSATSMIEPLMIAVMGVVVGGIAMALLLPIFTLSQSHG